MQQCCVIGGTGFIGHSVVNRLLKGERKITVIGRNPLPPRCLPEGVRYVAGDYGDGDFMTEVLQGVDEVINLAYSTIPKTSFDDPVQDILSNLPASVRLFEVASRLAVKKLVLVSSGGTVYGKAQTVPLSEEHPTNPISPYGITKLAIEKYAMMFKELKSLPVVIVRPANAYGEGQRPFVGQGFIATAIASILKGQEVVLFGETGTIRDYIYVSDVADGIIAVLEKGTPGCCYNIGTGIGRSNKDILDALYSYAESAGIEPRVKILPPRQFDVPANILECQKLYRETSWEPKVPFEEGIKKTWTAMFERWSG